MFIDKIVDLAVECGAFAFIESLIALGARGRELTGCLLSGGQLGFKRLFLCETTYAQHTEAYCFSL